MTSKGTTGEQFLGGDPGDEGLKVRFRTSDRGARGELYLVEPLPVVPDSKC